jgi:hypothetical protein
MGISSFSWEQENLLLDFLDKVENWVQEFVWDLSGKSRLALHKTDIHLTEMRWQIERRLKEKPEPSIADDLHKRLDAIQRVQVELMAVRPRVADMRATYRGYEVVATASREAYGDRAGLPMSAIQLRVSVPDKVRVVFDREMLRPDEPECPDSGTALRNIEWAALRDSGLDSGDVQPPRGRPHLRVIAQPQCWYLSIAPQIDGWVASVERLKSIQDFTQGRAGEQAGVITDSETLFRLAQESGCKSFLCKRLTE